MERTTPLHPIQQHLGLTPSNTICPITRKVGVTGQTCIARGTLKPGPPENCATLPDVQVEAQWERASHAHPANGVIPPVGTLSHGTISTTQAPTETSGTNPRATHFVL